MKKDQGISLLEIVIALAILAIFTLSAGGIYLSGWRLFRDAQYRAEAQASAQAAMAYMVKNIHNTATNFWIQQGALYARSYSELTPEFGALPPNIRRYHLDTSKNNLIYTEWTSQETALIGRNIIAFTPAVTHEDTIVEIDIIAEDSQGENPYNLHSRIHALCTAAPSVYESQVGP